MPPSCQQVFTIINRHGLHIRPCAVLAELVRQSQCTVTISKNGLTVDASRVIELLMLGTSHGETIQVTAEGVDCQEVMQNIAHLVATRFGVNEEPTNMS